MSRATPVPHPENCAGDFYVGDGCCLRARKRTIALTLQENPRRLAALAARPDSIVPFRALSCGVPLEEAPEVFAWTSDNGHCVVVRQPKTPESVDRVLSAIAHAEADCIRYRGTDPGIGRRLVQMGEAWACDHAPPADAEPLARTHVCFRVADGIVERTALRNADAFLAHCKQRVAASKQRFEQTEQRLGRTIIHDIGSDIVQTDIWRATLRCCWRPDIYHVVEFERLSDGTWLVVTRPNDSRAWIWLSRQVDAWLRAEGWLQDIRWYSAEQWRQGGPYLSTVV